MVGADNFDLALLKAAMDLAGREGWHRFSLVMAAQAAGLAVVEVRNRYPFKIQLLLTLNRMADDAALGEGNGGRTVRERLFERFMCRIDVFQAFREGVRAVMHGLPFDPPLAAGLGAATFDSMKWMADSAGLDCRGLGGAVRLQALLGSWTHTLRAWERDTTPDLTETMQALDGALDRAERLGLLKPLPEPESVSPPTDHETAPSGSGDRTEREDFNSGCVTETFVMETEEDDDDLPDYVPPPL
ncbi:TetR/AcrR family transcriptional regulator [Oecophyllibacter saccharovorans]|nr:TetR family transcriptional regulator [Oecophyllibacter saccharovorans]